jgi:hypothetical protein
MEHQIDEWEELYAEQAVYSKEFPANRMPYTINDNQPIESKLWAVVSLLSHGRCGGALGIKAEHIKAWLRGAKKEEDPETATSHVGAGEMWHKLFHLCSSIWNTGAISQQMCWVITVLILKGAGEYCGIRLLELIWKVLKKVMDLRLEAIVLHDSLHGCLVLAWLGNTFGILWNSAINPILDLLNSGIFIKILLFRL